MAYLHIPNLYQDQRVLDFKHVYALEKIHGTSAHIRWKDGAVSFFAGGAKHAEFLALFNATDLADRFAAMGAEDVTLFGEAYGGKMQGMRDTYGPDLKFIVFDVRIGDCWLAVPQMADVAKSMGMDVVEWQLVDATLLWLNPLRDAPSAIARHLGLGDKPREGIVIRPPFEVTANNGARIIAKHKAEAFAETKTPRGVTPDELQVLANANAIADEWVTEMRLTHVLDKLGATSIEQTGSVIAAMIEDVEREAAPEIIASPKARKAIGRAAALMFKRRLQASLADAAKEPT